MKKIKIIIAVILAFAAVASFASCKDGEESTSAPEKTASSVDNIASDETSVAAGDESDNASDADGLVGEWIFSYETGEIMASTFAAILPDLTLSENSLLIKGEYVFSEDGTYSSAIDTAALSESLEAYKEILAEDLKKYFDEKNVEKTDEEVELLLEALSAENIVAQDIDVNGEYTVTEVDGKNTLTLVPADEFGETSSEEYEIVSCDAKKLVLKQSLGSEFAELELTRR